MTQWEPPQHYIPCVGVWPAEAVLQSDGNTGTAAEAAVVAPAAEAGTEPAAAAVLTGDGLELPLAAVTAGVTVQATTAASSITAEDKAAAVATAALVANAVAVILATSSQVDAKQQQHMPEPASPVSPVMDDEAIRDMGAFRPPHLSPIRTASIAARLSAAAAAAAAAAAESSADAEASAAATGDDGAAARQEDAPGAGGDLSNQSGNGANGLIGEIIAPAAAATREVERALMEVEAGIAADGAGAAAALAAAAAAAAAEADHDDEVLACAAAAVALALSPRMQQLGPECESYQQQQEEEADLAAGNAGRHDNGSTEEGPEGAKSSRWHQQQQQEGVMPGHGFGSMKRRMETTGLLPGIPEPQGQHLYWDSSSVGTTSCSGDLSRASLSFVSAASDWSSSSGGTFVSTMSRLSSSSSSTSSSSGGSSSGSLSTSSSSSGGGSGKLKGREKVHGGGVTAVQGSCFTVPLVEVSAAAAAPDAVVPGKGEPGMAVAEELAAVAAAAATNFAADVVGGAGIHEAEVPSPSSSKKQRISSSQQEEKDSGAGPAAASGGGGGSGDGGGVSWATVLTKGPKHQNGTLASPRAVSPPCRSKGVGSTVAGAGRQQGHTNQQLQLQRDVGKSPTRAGTPTGGVKGQQKQQPQGWASPRQTCNVQVVATAEAMAAAAAAGVAAAGLSLSASPNAGRTDGCWLQAKQQQQEGLHPRRSNHTTTAGGTQRHGAVSPNHNQRQQQQQQISPRANCSKEQIWQQQQQASQKSPRGAPSKSPCSAEQQQEQQEQQQELKAGKSPKHADASKPYRSPRHQAQQQQQEALARKSPRHTTEQQQQKEPYRSPRHKLQQQQQQHGQEQQQQPYRSPKHADTQLGSPNCRSLSPLSYDPRGHRTPRNSPRGGSNHHQTHQEQQQQQHSRVGLGRGTAVYVRSLLPRAMAKYWLQRYSLFSRFDEGAQMDVQVRLWLRLQRLQWSDAWTAMHLLSLQAPSKRN